jgi:rhodanese-related sulfurtransferase
MFSFEPQVQIQAPALRSVLRRAGLLLVLSTAVGAVFNSIHPLGIHDQAFTRSGGELQRESPEGLDGGGNEPQAVNWSEVKPRVEIGDLILVDVRTAAEYEAGHIPGSISLPAMSEAVELAAFRRAYETNTHLVLYCGSPRCALSKNFARRLVQDFGYRSVSYILGGYLEWQQTQFGDLHPVDVERPSSITWPEAERLVRQNLAVLVDARSRSAYDAGHITGAVSLPFNTSADEINRFRDEYAGQGQIVLYCQRSTCTVAERFASKLVVDHGYRSVRFLSSGFEEWKVAQLNKARAER